MLFLVDRRALAAQAVSALAAFEPEPGLKFDQIYEVYSQAFHREDLEDEDEGFDPKVLPEDYLTQPTSAHAFVYVCTIQRMAINLLGCRRPFSAWGRARRRCRPDLDIPIHAFDVVRADECHRGYTAAEETHLAEVPRPLRRDQDRPDRDAGGAHHRLLRARPSTSMASSARWPTAFWWITTR